jgi:hypothetical protein
VLVDKLGAVIDIVVDHDVEILLGVVLSNILIGEVLGGHLDCCCRCVGGYFSGQLFSVSTVRANARDRQRDEEELGREAYRKFRDVGTAGGG